MKLRSSFWLLLPALCLWGQAARSAPAPSEVSVRDFGAKGDGKTDDTAAFTRAMAAVSEKGGTVRVPVGNYLIQTHLRVPPRVALEGIWKVPTAFTQNEGSTLLAVEGAGSENGTPFITLSANATLKGLTIFYPNQDPAKITPYPWCIRGGGGDNISIVDCLLVNPYQGVDFGTNASGRHYIRNLYGQPLRRGLFIDKCYDIGRIENVHFWPFWKWDEQSGIREWLWENGEAIIFGRTDWEYVFNTFVFGYRVGYRFTQTKDGMMNGNLLGIGADASRVAVQVDATAPYGLLITNGEFVSFAGEDPTQVVVAETNTGNVSFSNCSFWGGAHQIARLEGSGTTTFTGCTFMEWDAKGTNAPAISLSGGSLIVNGSNFIHSGAQGALTGKAESAVFMGNRMAGPLAVANPANADLQVGLNVFGKRVPRRVEEPGAIVLDDITNSERVTFTGTWRSVMAAGNYESRARWAVAGQGEATAAFRVPVPKAGRYAVFVYVGPDPNRDHATDAPVTVRAADGEHTVRVNQRETTGQWERIGEWPFDEGDAIVTITNDADANVLADAVKLVPIP